MASEPFRTGDRAGSARRPLRRAAPARLHARRPDRAPRGDRLRGARLGRGPARRLDRRAGRRHLPARSAATTRRCSATTSGRTRGRATSSRPTLRLWRARRVADGEPRGTRRSRAEPPRYALHRRALVRPARDRGRRTGSSWRAPASTATTAPAARAPSSSRSTAARPAATCFCVSMDTGPSANVGLRPRAHRAARRRRAPLPRRGRQRARRRGARRAPAPRRRRRGRRRRGRARSSERAAAQMGTDARHHRHQGPALPQPRAPALGRGRRPLPDLRQLHDGLPDLLLQQRRGRDRPRAARRPSARAPVGLVLHARALLHPRRQRAHVRRRRATASG